MGSTFNPQILMEKLAKLNSSQQSIETQLTRFADSLRLIGGQGFKFYHRKASSLPQNSRRKGSEFVGEFWKFLPDALRDVIDNGDEFGRNAALRLISIWEERKVFGSRGQILKEELVGRHLENNNRNGKHSGFKLLRHSTGNALDKIVSVYQVVYGGQLDEDVILGKCRDAISCIEKVDKEIGGDFNSVVVAVLTYRIASVEDILDSRQNVVKLEFQVFLVTLRIIKSSVKRIRNVTWTLVQRKPNGSHVVEELQGQHAILRDCIEQLTVVESSRANLVSHLREALQEQEFKLDQIRSQLQAAQSQSEQAGNLCRQLLNNNAQLLAEQSMKETDTSKAPHSFIMGSREQSAPVMYTRTLPFSEKSGEDPKATAAAVAAKLTASTSSAQMLSYVLSSLASEGVIGNTMKESSSDFPSEKRTKLENDHPAYIPSQNSQPPVPPYPHPDSLQHGVPITTQELTANEQPPPPSSPPPLPPLPPMQPYPLPHFMQTTPYGYGVTQQQPLPMPGYPFTAPPTNPYQSFQGSEGGFYSQPSSLPMAPISRQ
ncbi:unnamed protein product [Camellia sinensis]